MVYIIPFPRTDASTVRPFTLTSYHSESKYGIVNSIILNMFELWLNSYSLYATFESHSTSAQSSGRNFRISQHNFSDMNTPISDKYLGIVNPLLIITNLQVDQTNLVGNLLTKIFHYNFFNFSYWSLSVTVPSV